MGNFLESPNREKKSQSGKGTDISFNCVSMQGWRIEMEDAHTNILSLPSPFERWSFFAVYDGHAGAVVAKQSSTRLITEILNQTYFLEDLTHKSDLTKNCNYDIGKLEEAIRQAFLSLDMQMMGENLTSGTTVTGVLLTPKHLFFINCGDSRSLLVRKDTNPKHTKQNKLEKPIHPTYKEAIAENKFAIERLAADNPPRVLDPESLLNDTDDKTEMEGQIGTNTTFETDEYGDCEEDNPSNYHVYFSTIDHKPMDAEEKKRIEDAGGMVIIQRINGALAVSRALGDFDYKKNSGRKHEQQQVSAVPVITCIERTSKDDQFQDSFIVVACDGIYDAITNDNLASYLSFKLLSGENIDEITKDSLEFCLTLGSKDNMSLNFIGLSCQPKGVEWMVNKKQELDNKLKIATREIYDIQKKTDSHRCGSSNIAETIYHQLVASSKLQDIYKTYIYKHTPPDKYPNTTCDKKNLIFKFVQEFEEQVHVGTT